MINTTFEGWLLIAGFIALTAAMARPFGAWLFALYEGRAPRGLGWLRPVENLFYRAAGTEPAREQGWRGYAAAMMLFNLAGILLLLAIQKLQGVLPLNPQGFGAVPTPVAINTAVSFVTNTNWQSYSGEATMSNLTQMAGLTVQNFASAATGIAVAFALIRGFARKSAATLGNFWGDLVRVVLYVLLPVSVVYALVLIALGVPQTFDGSVIATTLEGARQTLALGPVASQEAIKMFGTNGGGFFNANSAHPFENPSDVSNFIQMLSIFALGSGLTWTFGKAVGNTRQGWAILAAMLVLFAAGTAVLYMAEAGGNPIHHALGLDPSFGNMEGKETRFGIAASALFASVTTAASCGAVNAMHDSFTAIGGFIPMFNMQLGEVIIGGVGAGLYGILLHALLAIFIAGLMVGRTPEYIGKKIEAREVKLAVIAIAVLPLAILGFTSLALVVPQGLAGLQAAGPHGLSEALYAYTSATANNGSAFAGLTASNPFWAYTLAIAMFVGRFAIIVPALAIAGSLAAKKQSPEGPGSFPTTGLLWVGLLTGLILILGGLTFLPGLALGPILKAKGLALLVVSAREATDEKVTALDLGADDYVTKPFDTEEVLARVRTALRQRLTINSETPIVRVGGVVIDLAARTVTRDGDEVRLRPKEYGFLAELARQPGKVVTHAQLLRSVWGAGHEHDLEYLRVAVRSIRKKLEDDPAAPKMIRNEPAVGYRLVNPDR